MDTAISVSRDSEDAAKECLASCVAARELVQSLRRAMGELVDRGTRRGGGEQAENEELNATR